MDYFWKILSAIFISGGIIGYYIRKLIDEKFEKNRFNQIELREVKRRNRAEKRKLALEIIKYCTEAQSSGFRTFPSNHNNETFLLGNHLETIDKEASTNFTLLFASWGMYSLALKGMPEVKKHEDEMFKTAIQAKKRLLEIASEWRKL